MRPSEWSLLELSLALGGLERHPERSIHADRMPEVVVSLGCAAEHSREDSEEMRDAASVFEVRADGVPRRERGELSVEHSSAREVVLRSADLDQTAQVAQVSVLNRHGSQGGLGHLGKECAGVLGSTGQGIEMCSANREG